ncbi:sulfate ABC transporter substrate-binding protein [Acetobacter sp. AN02]|uniref:sulfate ABC transporter substrate-binding protein n=1 Tax=Acetobacter sp. AN02 TaxID=2894186 RepID=UPI0024342B6A|nr:sulfate ABC transporter substrate-binding protein [Acetobacter sp. AN02]MDG6094651.1 sulfate ABC transporter substrate-binding protein [Acetobacter sp. AN02]
MTDQGRSDTQLSRRSLLAGGALLVAGAGLFCSRPARAATTLLNVSYDPTRELYAEVNSNFSESWEKARNDRRIVVKTSNGGSGAQARAVLEGVPADIVSLGLARDIDMLAASGLLKSDWQKQFPYNSTPYRSTIVFLVRKGNPRGIHDWGDLIRDDVKVITPNPKTSGGARWNYLAAWGWALHRKDGSEASAKAYLKKLFAHVPVLDTGARGATNSFVQRGLGDVLLAWENEALLAAHDLGPDQFDIVVPSVSILAEPPVALVDRTVDGRGTRPLATDYISYLFSAEGQNTGARHYFRPADPAIAAKYEDRFPKITTFDIASLGGWKTVHARHFAAGGIFDQISSS